MKIKYVFDRVRSGADTIEISCRGYKLMTFTKEDYGNDFSGLENQSFLIDELDCNDLSLIETKGFENHTTSFDENTNLVWKEITKNKLGSKHFDDITLISSFDYSQPIQIYDQTGQGPNPGIPYDKFESNYLLDLSHYKIKNVSSSIERYGPKIIKYFDTSEYTGTSLTYKERFKNMVNLIETPSFKSLPEDKYTFDSLFKGCISLTKINDLPNFPVTYTSTFEGCTALTEAPALIGAANATFIDCTGLTSTGDLIGVTTGNNMFDGCVSLTDVSENIVNLTSARFMFKGCTSLEKIPESVLDLEADTYGMFYNCTNLERAYMPRNATNPYAMYYGCKKLKSINIVPISCRPVSYSPAEASTSFIGEDVEMDTLDYLEIAPGNYDYGITSRLQNLGVVNVLPSCIGVIASSTSYVGYDLTTCCYPGGHGIWRYKPINIKALPTVIGNVPSILSALDQNYPTSTPFEWWVDNCNETEFVKCITCKSKTIERSFKTINQRDTYIEDIPFTEILQKSPSYPYSFELVSITPYHHYVDKVTNTGTVTLTTDADNKLLHIEIPCTNIEDDSKSIVNARLNTYYTALIDGYEFHGYSIINLDIVITCTMDENVNSTAYIVNDDGSDIE